MTSESFHENTFQVQSRGQYSVYTDNTTVQISNKYNTC